MCGIVGAYGSDAAEKVFSGLKSLEYRGYDSWGIAYPKENSFYVEKKVGCIGSAERKFPESVSSALGHTRWATHGNVTKENAHPHLSMNGKIALVHNGIVENYAELKRRLAKKGYKFRSQTDSEAIANLIQDKMKKKTSPEDAVRKALKEIEGNYAVVVSFAGEKKLVCARNGSPMVIGFTNDGIIIASDATAFIGSTKKALFLADGKMLVAQEKPVIIDVASGKKSNPVPKELNWGISQAKKGRFPHFLIKEIFEQPETIKAALNQPEKGLSKMVSMLRRAKRIFIVGSGTSYHASLSASYPFDLVAKRMVTPCIAAEFGRYKKILGKNDLVLAVSQSGETADLLGAMKIAREKKAKICSIVNVMGSSVMRESDCSLLMNAGPEISVLSTKSYTSQIALLYLLAYSVAGKASVWRKAIISSLPKFRRSIESSNPLMKRLAKRLVKARDIFVIGRHSAFPTALEAALKIKEVTYIHAEGYAGGELKHGPIALIEKGIPAIIFSDAETRKEILSNAVEMKSRGAYTIGIDSKKEQEFDFSVIAPDCGAANVISHILPMQLLAYHLAVAKKLDPDKPRNLAKSVTVK